MAVPPSSSDLSSSGSSSSLPEPFADWVAAVAEDPICVNEWDVNSEVQENMWTFGVPAGTDSANAEHVAVWRRFAMAVVDAREATLREMGCERASFVAYVWADLQAGQLRFGLMSASHGDLPFGAPTAPATLETVIDRAITPFAFDEDPLPTLVWAIVLPRGD